jgi:type II secretory pathway component PulF
MASQGKRIGVKELLDFTSNLSLLLNSGLSVYNAIQMIHSFSTNRTITALSHYCEEGLKKGVSLSRLIENSDYQFPPLYNGLVGIGDRIGSLSTILPTLRTYLERKKQVRDKFINASIYPLMVLLMLFTGMIFLTLFAVPRIEALFLEIGEGSTQIRSFEEKIFGLKLFGVFCIVLFIAVLTLFILRKNSPAVKEKSDFFFIRIPGIRHIITITDIFNVTFAVETLTRHGIPLSSAIKESVSVCGNFELKKTFTMIHQELVSGKNLYNSFSSHPFIPPRVKQWVGIGENTGETDKVFEQLRHFYEAEIDNLTTRLLGIIEPLLIIIVGSIIIYLILNFIVPLFSLFGTIV